jgi:hypothetical protein
MKCDLLFGRQEDGYRGLAFIDEKVRGVKWPKCSHYTCIDCFKYMWRAVLDPDSYELDDWPNELPTEKRAIDLLVGALVARGYDVDSESLDDDDVRELYQVCIQEGKVRASEHLRVCPLCRR